MFRPFWLLLAVFALFSLTAPNLIGQPGDKKEDSKDPPPKKEPQPGDKQEDRKDPPPNKGLQPGGAKKKRADDFPAFKKKAGTPVGLTYFAPSTQLITIDEVVKDLKLNAKEQDALKKAQDEYQKASAGDVNDPATVRLKKQQEATQKLNDTLKNTLGDKAKRLDQISAQGAGLPAYFTPAKAAQLGLNDDQIAKGQAILTATYQEMVQKATKDGVKLTAATARTPQHRTTFIDNATPKLLELLDKDQNKRWLDLIGDPLQPEVLLKVRTGNATGFGGFGGFNPPPGGGGGGGFNPPPGGGFGGGGFGGKKGGGPGGPVSAASRLASSQQAFTTGNYAVAEDMARKALDLIKEPTIQRGEAFVALGKALCKLNRLEDAETALKDALSVYEKQVGPYNPRFALTYNWLGACAQARGQLDKADQFQRKALDIHEKVDGPNSAEAAQIWTNIGNISVAQGKLNEAERQHRKALEIRENVLTKNHPQTAMSVHNLGAVLRMQGKAKEAEANGLRAVEMYRATNPNHGELVYPLRMLTDLCIEQKRWPDAEKHARAWLGVLEADRDDSLDELAETSFRRLDVNGDNKLNRDEMPARLKDNLAKWDRNDDGLVDAGEYRTYFSAELGDAVAPQHPGTTAMIEPLERLATILTATDRRDEAATVTKRKDSLKSKLASEKK